ncbi:MULTISPECIES: 50S ribosomal protein L9 [Rhodoluna]|jgi:large subunit ribosomal protein L9|uniref:50S ribosomal protein L9 n=1 Tax=Rhodoluna TaxID=529883 RepID=UPI00110607BA|nr:MULTISPECIES: 50S ribosomal protein L9 [Rhodoluna]BDS49719.1 50S ribosomal protein L9 [Rhodoluna sp. KAS3]
MSKLILTNEVSGLGGAGDVVEVKNGYARNYLLPRGFAVLWTKGGEKQIESIKAARDARALSTVEDAQALKAALEAKAVRLTAKAGVGGRLFGSVKTADVVAAVAAAGLGELDKRKVAFVAPIRNSGEHLATVRLHGDVVATITLQVVGKK